MTDQLISDDVFTAFQVALDELTWPDRRTATEGGFVLPLSGRQMRAIRGALETVAPLLVRELAADHAAAHRAVGCYLGVDSASLAADARALVERCTLAEFERDRLEQDAHEWLRVVGRVEAERDRLRQRVQSAREILTRAAAGCCGDLPRHIDEANQILSLGGAE